MNADDALLIAVAIGRLSASRALATSTLEELRLARRPPSSAALACCAGARAAAFRASATSMAGDSPCSLVTWEAAHVLKLWLLEDVCSRILLMEERDEGTVSRWWAPASD